MFPTLQGRINRKTYILANLIALGVLGAVCAIIVIPIAILDIALGNTWFGPILDPFYYLVLLPAGLYAFYFSTLMVKRAHDFNSPGLLWVIGFFGSQAVGRLLDIYLLNLVCFFVILFFCIKPGSTTRNSFGAAPRKSFKLNNLKVTF